MHKRLFLVFGGFTLLFLTIFARLFYWQVLSSDSLSGLSRLQLSRNEEITARRGTIFTSDATPLVINEPSYTVFAQPQLIDDKLRLVTDLAPLLHMDEASLSGRFTDDALKWVALSEQVSVADADAIIAKKFPGIGLIPDFKRYYPEGSMAAHLTGFVGKDRSGKPKGYFGLEGFYDEQLKGRPGIISQEKDALGNPILAGLRRVIEEEDGRDLYLTVDRTVQFIIEQRLKEALEKYGAKSGTVIVMDPHKGDILGMASLPSYDPDKRLDFDTEFYKNPALTFSYEPGSTFKILVMAAAVNENAVNPNDTFNEDGPLKMGAFQIKTWNQQYHGEIKIPEIIQYSSNVGMVYIAEKLGEDKFLDYLKKLGLGKTTGIDLQEEATPDLRPEEQWRSIDFATASFGQGIAVTPLQMIRMAASIANGGKLVVPRVVDRITDSNGNNIRLEPRIEGTVFRSDTAAIVNGMMVNAVEKGETKFLKPIGIRIAGKTGTAQIPISGHYDTEKTIASFIGFFPADNPRVIILTTLREPTSSPWGSETAAPLFFNIAKELISYYKIPLSG